MKILLDTNVILTMILREPKGFQDCVQVFSLSRRKNVHLAVTAVSLGATDYMATKRYGAQLSKSLISQLASQLTIIRCDEKETHMALSDKSVHDFEDGLQYYAALNARCTAIVTYDLDDYYFSKIPLFQPADFIRFLSKSHKK